MDGDISKLEQAIKEMKKLKMKKLKKQLSTLLNVCYITKTKGVTYSMSLLALSGFHERKDMVDLLLQEGAGI